MRVRLATMNDVPRIVEMGRRFRSESTYHDLLADSPEALTNFATKLISCDGMLLAETDQVVGMLGFIVYDHFMSGEKVAVEFVWWMEPEHRGEGLLLLEEAKRRARAQGAKRLQMISPSPRVSRLYRLLGFELMESTFQVNL